MSLENDLRWEMRELCVVGRHVFERFVDWWKFFVTANIALLAALTGIESLEKIIPPVALVVSLLDLAGVGFCLITACRFVQIADRHDEIVDRLYPGSERAGPRLPNPSHAAAMCNAIWQRLWNETLRQLDAPDSPLPTRYYLICVAAIALLCPLFVALWLAAMLWNC